MSHQTFFRNSIIFLLLIPFLLFAQMPTDLHTHVVVKGETLWRISRQYHIQVDELKAANHLPNDLIRVGQVLKIPSSIPPISPTLTPTIAPVSVPSKSSPPVEPQKSPRVAISTSASAPPPPPKIPAHILFRNQIVDAVKEIASKGVPYNGSWTPPDESSPWIMDCSNTSRYLYHRVAKIELPRTASDQYHQLRLQDRAWPVPVDPAGKPDLDSLEQNLRIGDLLFWEHTYEPEREPPVTHVMIFLGRDRQGRWLMAGSQQGPGLLVPSTSGPDLYVFNPLEPKGGYYRFLFFGRVDGRFSAYGRPFVPE